MYPKLKMLPSSSFSERQVFTYSSVRSPLKRLDKRPFFTVQNISLPQTDGPFRPKACSGSVDDPSERECDSCGGKWKNTSNIDTVKDMKLSQ